MTQAGWVLGRFRPLEVPCTLLAFLWGEEQRAGQPASPRAEGPTALSRCAAHGPPPGWSSSGSSRAPGSFSVTAFRVPGEGSSRGEGGSEVPSLHWDLGLSPGGRQRQGG